LLEELDIEQVIDEVPASTVVPVDAEKSQPYVTLLEVMDTVDEPKLIAFVSVPEAAIVP
jgi:hypothetical protein